MKYTSVLSIPNREREMKTTNFSPEVRLLASNLIPIYAESYGE
jgi:hypothetical protein